MQFKHLALTLSITLGLTAFTHATQLDVSTPTKKEVSIVKNVAAQKDRPSKAITTNKSALDKLIKTYNSEEKQTEDDRRVMTSITGKASQFSRTNKIDLFLQSLFGG